MEKTVEIKSCKNCSTQFEITDKDLEFYDKVSPVFGGTKYSIPTPTHCPDCRQQRRLAWRNERRLYRRKCDATGENIISIYSPDKSYKVYDQKVWWSDSWNPLDYGKDFDFTKSFFEQFNELLTQVPKISLYRDPSMENSEYTNYGQSCKDSYLCVNCYALSDSYYSTSCFPLLHEKEDANVDCEDCSDSSLIYECVDIKNSSLSFYCNDIEDCFECHFSEELLGCSYCLCSIGQTNKQYLFLNRKIAQEEFQTIKSRLLTDAEFRKKSLEEYAQLKKEIIRKASHNTQSENVSGDYIINCNNVHNSYFVGTTENGKFLYTSGYFSKNMYDGMNCGGKSDLNYEILHTHEDFKSAFLIDVDGTKDSYYCIQSYHSSNLFGCVGLRNKQYCILNKQYTKEEYEELVPRIIEHMQKTSERGEFFPIELSPFGYNETVAQEYYPLKQADASAKNYKWQTNNYDPQIPAGVETITKDNAPQDIQSVTDDILKKLFICEVTGRPFRIIKQELEFYKKHNLPLPTKHPDQRHLERLAKRNPRKLWKRKCDCSNCASNNNSNGAVEFLTTYSPERKEKVYCETCYNKEVYG